MPHDALMLTPHIVDGLFPFHILLSDDGSGVLSVGHGLVELLGEDVIGSSFEQLFDVCGQKNGWSVYPQC